MWRGTLLNELINLPLYWWKVFRVDTSALQIDKFAYGAHNRQYYLWARPQKVEQSKVIIYLHGGGWWMGKPEQFVQNAQFFTSQGYSVFLPSYRRVPKYNIEDIRKDLIEVLQQIKKAHFEESVPEIVLAGMSAGGHLAALLALDKSLLSEAGWPHDQIKGMVSWGGPLDLENTDPSLPQYWLLRSLSDEKKWLGNPRAFLKDAKPKFPIVIFHGTQDGMINNKSAKDFLSYCDQEQIEVHHHFLPNTHLEIATWSIPYSKFWDLSRKVLADTHII